MEITHALQILVTGKLLAGPALKGAGDAIASLTEEVSKAGGVLRGFGKVFGTTVTFPLRAASAAVGVFGAALGGLVKILLTTTVGVVGLATSLAALPMVLTTSISRITEYAAELEVARRGMWGIAGEAMPAMLSALREATAYMTAELPLIREYHMAYMLLGKDLAERLPEAMQYLTKVAAVTGDTVEYLTDRLVRSIGRLSTRWMAYIGTVVPMEEALARASEMFGKTANELTYTEKQAGMLDKALEKLKARTAALPEVFGTAKQMSLALKASWKDLWGDVSTLFLPVARALYTNLSRTVETFKHLISEGGALYGPIRKITAAFTVLFEIVGELTDRFFDVEGGVDSAVSVLERFADRIISMAWEALTWGANIAVNLAAGLVRGSSTALIGAMNFIANLLKGWLAPGSAPRIVPEIAEWGAETFTEYLRGFSMAQFDVLEGLQRPLKRILSVMVSLGDITAVQAGQTFVSLSQMMTGALEEFARTGEVSGDVFERLLQVGGDYGESLVELLRRQLDLATAVKILAAAEERLKNAHEGEDKATAALSKQAREYNRLVAQGADPAVLRAKLAEVEASYDSLVVAREETEAAEEAQDAAEGQLKFQREQLRLQERLVNQLIVMGQTFTDLLKAQEGVEPVALPEIEYPEFHPPPIDEAFLLLKERIRGMFEDLWADLKTQWEESGAATAIRVLAVEWEMFRTNVLIPVGKAFKEHIWDPFKAWAADEAWPWVLGQWETWKAWWEENGPLIGAKISEVRQAFGYWATDRVWSWTLEQWEKLKIWWEESGPLLQARALTVWTVIGEVVGAVTDVLINDIWPSLQAAFENLGEVLAMWGFDWEDVWRGAGVVVLSTCKVIGALLIALVGTIAGVANAIAGMIEYVTGVFRSWSAHTKQIIEGWVGIILGGWYVVKGIFTGDTELITVALRVWWEGIKNLWSGGLGVLVDSLKLFFGTALVFVYKFCEGIINFFINLRERLIGHSIIGDMMKKITGAFTDLPGQMASAALAGLSRMVDLGRSLMSALRNAVTQGAQGIANALQNVVQAAIDAAEKALGIGSESKVFWRIGEGLVKGFVQGIEHLKSEPALAVGQIAGLTTTAVGVTSEAAGMGTGGAAVVVNNYFQRDSIRSKEDIEAITEAVRRSLTLRGARLLY